MGGGGCEILRGRRQRPPLPLPRRRIEAVPASVGASTEVGRQGDHGSQSGKPVVAQDKADHDEEQTQSKPSRQHSVPDPRAVAG